MHDDIKVDRCTVSTTRKTRYGDFFVCFSAEVTNGKPMETANILSLKDSMCALNHAHACLAMNDTEYQSALVEIKEGYANLIGVK